MDPNGIDALRSAEWDGSQDERSWNGRVPHGGAGDPFVLDFSANTNPESPEGVAGVYEGALSAARSYPSDDYCEFRGAAAEYVGCEGPQVIPTAGGLAAIRLTVATTVDPDDTVLVPYPSFGEYAREVGLQGGTPEFVPHDDLLSSDPGEYALVVCCTPNNPTGEAYDPAALRAYAGLCRDADTPFLVDEAFVGFTDEPTLAGHEGVVVARSLTKLFGLPGLRAGFAVATGDLRDRLEVARPAWGLGTPAAAVGVHCMRAEGFVAATRERVASERARMEARLSARFEVSPSDGPFLLLDVGDSAAVDDLLSTVKQHDITVRDARTFRGLDSHVRVAVRLPEENDRLLDALDV